MGRNKHPKPSAHAGRTEEVSTYMGICRMAEAKLALQQSNLRRFGWVTKQN